MNTFVVGANTLSENYSGPTTALIEVSPELLETIRSYRTALSELQKKRPSTYSVSSWSGAVTFIAFIEDDPSEDRRPFHWKEPDEDAYTEHATDTKQMVVTDDGVYWEAQIKHASVTVETFPLSWEQLGLEPNDTGASDEPQGA